MKRLYARIEKISRKLGHQMPQTQTSPHMISHVGWLRKNEAKKTKKIIPRGGRDASPSARHTTLGEGPCRPIYFGRPSDENPTRIRGTPPPPGRLTPPPSPQIRRCPALPGPQPHPTPSPLIRCHTTSTLSPATTTLPGDLHSLPTTGSYSGRGGGLLHSLPDGGLHSLPVRPTAGSYSRRSIGLLHSLPRWRPPLPPGAADGGLLLRAQRRPPPLPPRRRPPLPPGAADDGILHQARRRPPPSSGHGGMYEATRRWRRSTVMATCDGH
jgi:hypothetical protein